MDRKKQIQQLQSASHWDFIIIGGGATGLGSALDAASRGYKVLCVEKNDFSKGTSSRSTKLIHGGVRYLEQGNINMVKDALQERWFLLNNASDATKKLSFVLPVYSWWRFIYYAFGLILYDILSGKFSIGKTRMMNNSAVIKKIPEINKRSLVGGIRYFDGQFDDSQICIALARTATDHGATVINHMSVQSFLYDSNHKICGVELTDMLTGDVYTSSCTIAINATGVFSDIIMKMDNPSHHNIIKPSRGIHVVVNKSFYSSPHAMLIPKTTDGRVLFAVPWYDKVIIGTTDTNTDNICEEPKAEKEEIDFILNNFNAYMQTQIDYKNIISVFAGLRPLIRKQNITSTADLVRDHSIIFSKSGLITITGGKWTTYRKMARDVINLALKTHTQLPYVRTKTRALHLNVQRPVSDEAQTQRIHPDYTFTVADVLFAIRHEMACTLEDILARRIRLLFLDAKAALVVAPKVCKILQTETGKDDDWYEHQLASFKAIAENYLSPSSPA
ncbi:MAG: glycerol-3-phosphate dehydrogenase/oxidase [Saprospiraceae bacterium]